MTRAAALVAAFALTACGATTPRVADGPREQPLRVVSTDADGRARVLAAHVCVPAGGPVPRRIAIVNHGAPPDPGRIGEMVPPSCDGEVARWFAARGYDVVFALRRGFGRSEGPVAENSGACDAPDYVPSGLEGARDIAAMVRAALALPDTQPDGLLVVGQSTGGWASLAYASLGEASRAAAVLNFAGGRGGLAFGKAGTYCRPDRLVAGAGVFGATTRVPTLWVYAVNDKTFTPDVASAMARAFAEAGGDVEFDQPAAFGEDGHMLLVALGGSAIWGPLVEDFLRRKGLAPGLAPVRVSSR